MSFLIYIFTEFSSMDMFLVWCMSSLIKQIAHPNYLISLRYWISTESFSFSQKVMTRICSVSNLLFVMMLLLGKRIRGFDLWWDTCRICFMPHRNSKIIYDYLSLNFASLLSHLMWFSWDKCTAVLLWVMFCIL